MKLLRIALYTLLGLFAVMMLNAALPEFAPWAGDSFVGGMLVLSGTLQLWLWRSTPRRKSLGTGPWWASFIVAVGLTDLLSHSGPVPHQGSHFLVLCISLRAVVVEWRKARWSGLSLGALWLAAAIATMINALSIEVPRQIDSAMIPAFLAGGAAWAVAKAVHAYRRRAPLAMPNEL